MSRIEHLSDTVTLMLGDCREILPGLPRVDVTISDPPYGVGLITKTSDYRDSKFFDSGKSLQASVLYRDDAGHVRDLIRSVVPMCLALADRALFFPGTAMLWEYPKAASLGSVFSMAGAGRNAWGFTCTHPVLFYGKDPFLADGRGSRPNSLKDDQPNGEKIDHPCPKPLAWMVWAVARASRESETILDPFMGSGTTGVACVQLGRKFIGIEIEEKYFDIACRRIADELRRPRLPLEDRKPSVQEVMAI